jgi:hypothetical protein
LSVHIIDGSKLNTICKSKPSRKNFFFLAVACINSLN